jgi:hypothetical protein
VPCWRQGWRAVSKTKSSTLTAGASGIAEQEACRLLITRSSLQSSASSAAAARRVCTMSAGVVLPGAPVLASLAAERPAAVDAGAAAGAALAAGAAGS